MTQSIEWDWSECERRDDPRSAPPHEVRIVTVREFEGLQPHLEAWDRLVWESPQALATMLPMRARGWSAFFRSS